jgi:hypothetical protein
MTERLATANAEEYEVELWPIARLQANPRNYRSHPAEQVQVLRASLLRHGQQKPIVVTPEGVILAGHGVLEAAKAAGWQDVAVKVYTGSNPEAYLVDDNETERLAVDDEQILARLLQERQQAGTLDSTGWDEDSLRELLSRLESGQGSGMIDPGPGEPPAEPFTQVGDVWQLGDHRLVCGDARDSVTLELLLEGNKAQLAITSPPYGVGKEYEEKGITPWFETVKPVIENLGRYAEIVCWQMVDLYATGSQFIEPTLAYSIQLFMQAGMRPIWIRVWEKQGLNFGVGPYHLVSNKPAQQYEYVATFADESTALDVPEERPYAFVTAFAQAQHRYVARLTQAERKAWGYAGIWKINTVRANDLHPAMFPVELPERCLKMHSDAGGLILEPFCGAGTTLIAAERLGRRCRAVELQPAYCDVTIERWQRMTGKIAVRVSDGAYLPWPVEAG